MTDAPLDFEGDEEEISLDDEVEDADLLEDEEADPVGFWEQRQRDLVTSILNYNLGTVADLIQQQKIDLSPRYQRRFRWDAKRQSKLIESFLMNVPVPPIFLNEDGYGTYSVIDGKQRLTAVYEFLRGRLKLSGLTVFSEVNGLSFDDLPTDLQNVLLTRASVQAIIILRQSDRDVKFEVFQRLNTGGVRLNAQEIRNSTWPGPFNDLILELSESREFHQLLGVRQKNRSGLWKEMRDVEFVLRFFTFRDTWANFSGGMKREMDRCMVSMQGADEERISAAQRDFLLAVETVSAAYGDMAFRRWMPSQGIWRQQVLASLYDAQMFGCRGLDPSTLAEHRPVIVERTKEMFSDETFRKSIDAATNTPALFRTRITMTRDLLLDVCGPSR